MALINESKTADVTNQGYHIIPYRGNAIVSGRTCYCKGSLIIVFAYFNKSSDMIIRVLTFRTQTPKICYTCRWCV